MDLDEIKKLSPSERIEKLKELEKKKKQEAEEAKRLLMESEHEVALNEIKRGMPIPQLRSTDESNLVSAEEKEMFKAKRFGLSSKVKTPEDTIIRDDGIKELENMIASEKEDIERFHREHAGQMPEQYGNVMQKAMEYQKVLADFYDAAKAGTITYEQMQAAHEIQEKTNAAQQQYRSADDAVKEQMDMNSRILTGIFSTYKHDIV